MKKKFLVWSPESGETIEDAEEFAAVDAQDAAEEWAEYDDVQSAEYSIVKGHEATVHVSAGPGMEVEVFTVTGEALPTYYAHKVEPTEGS